MTKQEAIDLETLCEAYLKEEFNCDLNISMNLTGRLKLEYDDNFIVIDKDFSRITYINYTGNYEDLIDDCNKFIKCVNEYKERFQQLVWSYEHINELEEE